MTPPYTHRLLAAQIAGATEGFSESELASYIRQEAFIRGLGQTPSDAAVDSVVQAVVNVTMNPAADEYQVSNTLAAWNSEAIGINWGSNGHSQVDVNLHVYTKRFDVGILKQFIGSHPNTFVGDWIAKTLRLDLESISSILATDGSLGNATYLEELRNGLDIGE
jgi:hypothetical protein